MKSTCKNIIKVLSLALLFTIGSKSVQAQQDYYTFRVGPTYGATLYYGDLVDDYPRLSSAEQAYGLNLEAALSKTFSLRLAGVMGELGYNDRVKDLEGDYETDYEYFDRGLNFLTEFAAADLSLVWHSDNGRLLSDDAFFAPYLTLGVGATFFEVFGDLKDADGNLYNLSDQTLEQDEDFETNLTELDLEDANYDDYGIHIPLGLGLKFRLSDQVNLNLESNFRYMVDNDYIDDVSDRKNVDTKDINDIYSYHNVSLHYNFGLRKKSFKAPVIIADEYSALAQNDSMDFRLGEYENLPPDTLVTDDDLKRLEKKRKEASDAERKQLDDAVSEAKKQCKKECSSEESGKDRRDCKKECGEDGYLSYLPINIGIDSDDNPYYKTEEEIAEASADIKENAELNDKYEARLDSLKEIIKQEESERAKTNTNENTAQSDNNKDSDQTTDKNNESDNSSTNNLSDNSNDKAQSEKENADKDDQAKNADTDSNNDAALLPNISSNNNTNNDGNSRNATVNPDSNAMNATGVRAMLNERDIRDLKIQMEIMRQQQATQSQLDAYRFEIDRLRQENGQARSYNSNYPSATYRTNADAEELQKQLNEESEIKNDIKNLEQQLDNTQSVDTTRINELNQQIEDLRNDLDELNKKDAEEKEKFENENDELRKEINRLRKELEDREANDDKKKK